MFVKVCSLVDSDDSRLVIGIIGGYQVSERIPLLFLICNLYKKCICFYNSFTGHRLFWAGFAREMSLLFFAVCFAVAFATTSNGGDPYKFLEQPQSSICPPNGQLSKCSIQNCSLDSPAVSCCGTNTLHWYGDQCNCPYNCMNCEQQRKFLVFFLVCVFFFFFSSELKTRPWRISVENASFSSIFRWLSPLRVSGWKTRNRLQRMVCLFLFWYLFFLFFKTNCTQVLKDNVRNLRRAITRYFFSSTRHTRAFPPDIPKCSLVRKERTINQYLT